MMGTTVVHRVLFRITLANEQSACCQQQSAFVKYDPFHTSHIHFVHCWKKTMAVRQRGLIFWMSNAVRYRWCRW